MVEHVIKFQNFLKSIGKSQATYKSYASDVQHFLLRMDELKVTALSLEASALEDFVKHLKSLNYSSNSIRRSVIAIRQFYRYLVQVEAIKESPFDTVVIPITEEKGTGTVNDEDIQTLFSVAEWTTNELKKLRDQVILSLLAYEGIKVSELIALKWHDFLDAKDKCSLRIRSDKKRILVLSDLSAQKINRFKKECEKSLGYLEHLNIILGFKGRDGALISPSISRHGLKFMLSELKLNAKMDHLNSEYLRHYAMDYQLKLGKPPEEVMEHLGLKRLGNITKHLPEEYA